MQDDVDRNIARGPASATTDPATRTVRLSLLFWTTYLILLLGLAFSAALFVLHPGLDAQENGWQITFHLLATQDAQWLVVAVLAYPVAWYLSHKIKAPLLDAERARMVVLLTFVVFAITALGTPLIYHDFALSMDEFMMQWHSQLLRYGYLLAPVPEEWLDLSYALRPGFLLVDFLYQTWVPGYRPGTAFLHAGFSLMGLGAMMMPLFCAASVLVLWRLACRVLPQKEGAVLCAVLLFASSSQFLITGMTPYTMTAHLLATLVWIWLFMMDRPASHAAAIVLGCYALGLHHVHVHSFMALPFLVHLAFGQRRWGLAAVYGLAYCAAGLGWIFWIDVAVWAQGLEPVVQDALPPSVDGDLGFVAMAVTQAVGDQRSADIVYWATNATRLIAWQNLAVLPLVGLALWHLRRAPLMLRLLAWSLVTSLVPYILLMPSQGHGWGYRYLHQCMGHIALLAGYGWAVAGSAGLARLRSFAVMLAVVSITVALPMRAVQTEAAVRPFAKAMDHLHGLDTDIALILAEPIWYGNDLVRNDPLLGTAPIILALEHVPETALSRLCAQYRVMVVSEETLLASGMQRRPDAKGRLARLRTESQEKLARAGCPG